MKGKKNIKDNFSIEYTYISQKEKLTKVKLNVNKSKHIQNICFFVL